MLITVCFDTLKTYGKTFEQLDSIIKLFELVLKEYDIKTIEEAFLRYVQSESEMPTPHDIIKIIDPSKNRLKWDSEVFKEIKRKMRDDCYVSEDEIKYCNNYMNHVLINSL